MTQFPHPSPAAADAFVCMMYHSVCRDLAAYDTVSPSITSYFVSEEAFAGQLDEIAALGGRCLKADDLEAFFRPRGKARAGTGPGYYPVLLTFDDGWRESIETAGPLLASRGWDALLFVTTEFVGRPHFPDRAELARLPQGLFRIGSHGRSHRMLCLLNDKDIWAELHDSKAFLEDVTGAPVETVSIPSGALDERVQRIAAEVGYRFIFTSEARVNRQGDSPLAIARVAVKRNTSPEAFRRYIRHQVTRERVRRWVLGFPKRLLGLARYEKLRRRLLGEISGHQLTHES